MTDFLSRALSNIANDHEDEAKLDEDLLLVNVRVSDKLAAMIDVMTEVNQRKLPSKEVSDACSQAIADMLLTDKRYVQMLKYLYQSGSLPNFYEARSALNVLSDREVVIRHFVMGKKG